MSGQHRTWCVHTSQQQEEMHRNSFLHNDLENARCLNDCFGSKLKKFKIVTSLPNQNSVPNRKFPYEVIYCLPHSHSTKQWKVWSNCIAVPTKLG